MKGKPWSVEEEKKLRELVLAHRSLGVIVGSLGKTKESIRCKMARMGLVDDNQPKSERSLSTKLVLSAELPSLDEALKKLAAAMKALETPDLSKTEVLRLRSIIQATGVYQVKVAE